MTNPAFLIAELRQKTQAIGPLLESLITRWEPSPPHALAPESRWIFTGVGLSEGAAQMAAFVFAEKYQLAARFVPLSAFINAAVPADILVVFSNSLGGNARFPLQWLENYQETICISSHTASIDFLYSSVQNKIRLLRLPELDENNYLLKTQSPLLSCALAFSALPPLVGQTSADPQELAAAYQQGRQQEFPLSPEDLNLPLAFVTQNHPLELSTGLAWKWLEATSKRVLQEDVFRLFHGPIQSLAQKHLILELIHQDSSQELSERLEKTIQGRHHYLPLGQPFPLPHSYFFWEGALNQLLVRYLAYYPRQIDRWPVDIDDQEIYRFAPDFS